MEQKNYKYRQIKTIRNRLDKAEQFDEDVNEALADGWYLVKRYTLNPGTEDRHCMLVAELQQFIKKADEYDY